MNEFEDPIQFKVKKRVKGVEIEFLDLMEISQGGPEIGDILINGGKVQGKYGGPFLCRDKYIYVPAYFKKIFGTGFKLARINTNTLKVEYLSKIKDLIFLDKIEGDRIYYYKDINKSLLEYHEF